MDRGGLAGRRALSGALLFVFAAGCDSASPLVITADRQLSSVFIPAPLEALARRCHRSGGVWSDGLVSCVCPQGGLFRVDAGCRPFSLPPALEGVRGGFGGMSTEALAEALEVPLVDAGPWHVTLDVGALSAAEAGRVAYALDADPSRLLLGAALPPQDATTRAMLRLERATPDTWEGLWGADRELDYPAHLTILSADPLGGLAPLAEVVDPSPCEAGLAEAGVAQGEAVCGLVAETLTALRGGAPDAFDATKLTEEGPGCEPDCAFVGVRGGSGLRLTYTVTMQRYAPLNRMLRITGPSDLDAMVFIGPRGQVEATVVRRHTLAGSPAPHLLLSSRDVLGARWDLLGGDVTPRGDRASLERALLGSGAPRGGALPTDSPGRRPFLAPQVALLIDSGIDPRLPGLRRRLNLAPLSLAMYLESNAPFTAVSADPVRALLNILDDDEMEGRHGTRVASVIAADLPRLQLSFIRSLDLLDGDVEAAPDRWTAFIARSHAAVVNISVTYSRLVADCDAIFDPIFRGSPDVLFVVAAGNSGAQDPTGTCPAALAGRFPNVVTVAGMAASGRTLHPHSNHGVAVAKVAAPYEGLAAEASGSLATPVARLAPMHGTSLSAALVSNAALRLRTRHPEWTAARVAHALMQACRPQGLDVACGGGLDFHHLEAL
jgi:hypothetical protein